MYGWVFCPCHSSEYYKILEDEESYWFGFVMYTSSHLTISVQWYQYVLWRQKHYLYAKTDCHRLYNTASNQHSFCVEPTLTSVHRDWVDWMRVKSPGFLCLRQLSWWKLRMRQKNRSAFIIITCVYWSKCNNVIHQRPNKSDRQITILFQSWNFELEQREHDIINRYTFLAFRDRSLVPTGWHTKSTSLI